MITKRQIQSAYKKVCPDVSPSIIDMFTKMIQDAIHYQDGSIFANRKAKKLKEVFARLTGVRLPDDIDAAHHAFDTWMLNDLIKDRKLILDSLIDRVEARGVDPNIPDGYNHSSDHGFWSYDQEYWEHENGRRIGDLFASKTVIIVKLHGRVTGIYSNIPGVQVSIVDGPEETLSKDNTFRRIA